MTAMDLMRKDVLAPAGTEGLAGLRLLAAEDIVLACARLTRGLPLLRDLGATSGAWTPKEGGCFWLDCEF